MGKKCFAILINAPAGGNVDYKEGISIADTFNEYCHAAPIFKKAIPAASDGWQPTPFANNCLAANTPGIERLTTLLGLGSGERIQWINVPKPQGTDSASFDDLVLFAAMPRSWHPSDIINSFGNKGINPLATYITKVHEVYGPAVLCRRGGNLTKGMLRVIIEASSPAKQAGMRNDTATVGMQQYQIQSVEEPGNASRTPTTEAERRAVAREYVHSIVFTKRILPMERAYTYMAAQIEAMYVRRGLKWFSTEMCYPVAPYTKFAPVMLSLTNGAKDHQEKDYLWAHPHELKLVKPDNYEEIIKYMRQQIADDFVPVFAPDEEKAREERVKEKMKKWKAKVGAKGKK